MDPLRWGRSFHPQCERFIIMHTSNEETINQVKQLLEGDRIALQLKGHFRSATTGKCCPANAVTNMFCSGKSELLSKWQRLLDGKASGLNAAERNNEGETNYLPDTDVDGRLTQRELILICFRHSTRKLNQERRKLLFRLRLGLSFPLLFRSRATKLG